MEFLTTIWAIYTGKKIKTKWSVLEGLGKRASNHVPKFEIENRN